MALNKKKVINGASLYALVSQFIISIIVLTLLGFYIGKKISPDTSLNGILGSVGALIGVMSFIIQLLYLERRNHDKKSRL